MSPSATVQGLRDHKSVHFTCHGTLETGKPFDASFKFQGGEHLTLLDIVCSRLPAAEFAFLSPCHTDEPTDENTADKGLHLAAAAQYCGFRSAVGTTCTMTVTDGWDLAKYFFKYSQAKREG